MNHCRRRRTQAGKAQPAVVLAKTTAAERAVRRMHTVALAQQLAPTRKPALAATSDQQGANGRPSTLQSDEQRNATLAGAGGGSTVPDTPSCQEDLPDSSTPPARSKAVLIGSADARSGAAGCLGVDEPMREQSALEGDPQVAGELRGLGGVLGPVTVQLQKLDSIMSNVRPCPSWI